MLRKALRHDLSEIVAREYTYSDDTSADERGIDILFQNSATTLNNQKPSPRKRTNSIIRRVSKYYFFYLVLTIFDLAFRQR